MLYQLSYARGNCRMLTPSGWALQPARPGMRGSRARETRPSRHRPHRSRTGSCEPSSRAGERRLLGHRPPDPYLKDGFSAADRRIFTWYPLDQPVPRGRRALPARPSARRSPAATTAPHAATGLRFSCRGIAIPMVGPHRGTSCCTRPALSRR